MPRPPGAGPERPGPGPDALPADLRFLKLLVAVLAGTMILGLLTIVALLVTRLPGGSGAEAMPALPAGLAMPAGRSAEAVTLGRGWVAVVTGGGTEILIFDAGTGALRQTLTVAP